MDTDEIYFYNLDISLLIFQCNSFELKKNYIYIYFFNFGKCWAFVATRVFL